MKRILLIFTLFIFYSPLMSKDFDFDKHLYGLKPGMKKDVALKLLDSKGVKYEKKKNSSGRFFYELSDSLDFFDHKLKLMFEIEKNNIDITSTLLKYDIPSTMLDILKEDCNCMKIIDYDIMIMREYYYDNTTITVFDYSEDSNNEDFIGISKFITKCKE